MSLLLWFITMIALLLVMGVEMNTVVMSGAAFLSAITVSLSTSITFTTLPHSFALAEATGGCCMCSQNAGILAGAWVPVFMPIIPLAGYIYQHFITAVIFVAFTNPYNIGDRVRVDGGDILYVRRIRTYTTEFESMHGKPVRRLFHPIHC